MGIKVISKNKRASYDFFLDDKLETGIELQGTEVKSLRAGKCVMNDAYCMIDQKQEVWIYNLNIPHYEFGNIQNHNETRKRKLLLKKEEIIKLEKSIKTQGQTLIPTMIYFKGSLIKMEIALAKGKKLHDKREATKEKDVKRKLSQGNYE